MGELHDVRTIKAGNLDNLDADVTLEYAYSAEGCFSTAGNTLTGRLPASWEMEELRLPADQPVRRIPIWQQVQMDMNCVTTIIPPAGYVIAPAVTPAPLNTPYFTMSFEEKQNGDAINIAISYSKTSGLFQAGSRDERANCYDRALDGASLPIVLVKK